MLVNSSLITSSFFSLYQARPPSNSERRISPVSHLTDRMDSDDFVPFVTNPPANSDSNELSSSAVFQPLITDVRAPWMQFSGGESDYGSSSSSLVRLHNEILSFCEYTAPTKVTFAASGARNIITTSAPLRLPPVST